MSVSRSRPYKFSVNYDQIESKPSPLVNQCRGLVLRVFGIKGLPLDDKAALLVTCPGDTQVLARPFDRFFNQGDPNAAEVDWSDPLLEVQEKLDGTLAIVYWDPVAGEWCMSTRSVPDADLPFESLAGMMTYRELFNKALINTTGLSSLEEFMYDMDTDLTFCFELTSPWNRIVVDYHDERLTFIGCRNRLTGIELGFTEVLNRIPGDLLKYFPHTGKSYNVRTLEQITQLNESLSPTASEGVVVVDSQFRRVKIKSVAYLAANRVKGACSTSRGLMELILLGREDDVVSLVPAETVARVALMKAQLGDMCRRLDDAHGEFLAASEGNQKAYALLVLASGLWTPPLFEMRVRKLSAREWIDSKKTATGDWANSFLENLLAAVARFVC